MKRFRIFLSVLSICAALSFGQRSLASEILTIEDAVAAAISANPELSAAQHAAEAARARAPQAATPPDPTFMVDFIGVPSNTADVAKGTVQYMVEQQIPFPGKLVYGYKAEGRAADAAEFRKTAELQDIIRETKLAYLEVWRLGEEARIEREIFSTYRVGKASAEEAYADLKVSVADPVRAGVYLSEVEVKLAVIEEERIGAVANLSRAMSADLDVSVATKDPPPVPAVAKLENLVAKAKETRPEIGEASKMAESEKARLSFAKSQYGPDIVLRWGFMDNPSGLPNAWYGRAGISLPLWSLSKQRLGVRESRATLSRANSLESAAALAAESEVKNAYARLISAKKISEIYSSTILPRAQMLLSSTQEAYKSGKGDFLSVIDSIRGLNDARITLVRAKVDEVKAYADLERAVGTNPAEAGE